jgi:hypothetical protein
LAERLIELLTTMLGPFVFEFSLGLLLILWIALYIYVHVIILRPVYINLKQFTELLSGLDDYSNENHPRIEEYIYSQKDITFLRDLWNEFKEKHNDTSNVDQCFNKHTMVTAPARRNQAKSLPAFFLTVGLTLSLFCLLLRFPAAQPVSDFTSLLYTAVSEVIVIALFSILLSFITAIVNRYMFSKADAWVYEINKLLKRKLPLSDEESEFDKMAAAIDNMASSLSSYAQYQADIQRNGMNQLVDVFLEKLHSEMDGQMQVLGESLQSVSETQMQLASQTGVFINELIKGTRNQMQVNEVTDSIVSSIARYHEQISSSSQSLAGSLEDLHMISQTLNNMITFSSDALMTVKQERESLKDEYGKYIQEMIDLIQKYRQSAADEVIQAINRFTDVSEQYFNKLEDTVNRSMHEWINTNQSAVKHFEEKTQDFYSVSKEVSQLLGEMNNSLRETMKEFTQAIEKGTINTITEFDEGLTDITKRLSHTITEIRDSIDEIPAVINMLKEVNSE